MDQSQVPTEVPSTDSSPQHQSSSIFSTIKNRTKSLIPGKKSTSIDNESDRGTPILPDGGFDHYMQAGRSFRAAVTGPNDDDEINNSITCYRNAIKLCDQSQVNTVYLELGSMYAENGRHEEAGQCFIDSGCRFGYQKAVIQFIKTGNLVAAISACEMIPETDRSNEDRILAYLLKLLANNIHVIRVVQNTSSQQDDMNPQESFCTIRFPVLPLVPYTNGKNSNRKSSTDKNWKPEEELMLMNEDALSLNIVLESLYYYLRDVRNSVNSDSNNQVSDSCGDEHTEENEDEGEDVKNEEKLIRNELLNELFARICDPLHRKLIQELLDA